MQKDEVVFNDSSLSYITRKNLLTARGSAAAAHSLMSASTGFDENDYETRSFLKKVKTQPRKSRSLMIPCTKLVYVCSRWRLFWNSRHYVNSIQMSCIIS